MRQKMFLGAGNLIFQNATELKRNMTHAELVLWGHLKGKQLGAKFRRQHPIGQYIADFYCHQHKLIIEIDGGIHQLPEIADNDIERQLDLEANGIKIIRFTNEQIFSQLEKVLNDINKAVSSPFRGR